MIRIFSRSFVSATLGCMLLAAGCQQAQQNNEPKTAPGQLPSLSTLKSDKAPIAGEVPKINAATYYAHAHLLERQGNYQQAAEQYLKVLELQPTFTLARSRLGVTYNKLGRNTEATQLFRECLAEQPNIAFLHNNLGFSLFLEQRYEEADAPFRKAIELKPDFTRAHMNLAVNLARRNQFDAAFQEFTTVCSQADSFFNVGILLIEANRYGEAAQYLEAALAANPQFDAARKQLNELARLAANDGNGSATPIAIARPMLTAIEPPGSSPQSMGRTQTTLVGDSDMGALGETGLSGGQGSQTAQNAVGSDRASDLVFPPSIPVIESPQPVPSNPGTGG